MITYRRATLEDLPVIKKLTDEMLEHTKLGVATSNKIKNILSNSAMRVDLAFVDSECVGYMAGVVHETLFNDIVRVSDIGMYVVPQHRGGEIVNTLLARYEEWALSRGAKQSFLGQTTGNRVDLTRRFYERRGYTIVGVNCIKDL